MPWNTGEVNTTDEMFYTANQPGFPSLHYMERCNGSSRGLFRSVKIFSTYFELTLWQVIKWREAQFDERIKE